MLIFGGYTDDGQFAHNVTKYNLATKQWDSMNMNQNPVPRSRHASVQTSGNKMLLFGGNSHEAVWLNDLHSFDPVSAIWTELHPLGISPAPRGAHSFMIAPSDDAYIFGGFNNDGFRNDVVSYHIGTNRWHHVVTKGEKPDARIEHSAVFSPKDNSMVVFGGQRWWGPEGMLNDVWKLDLSTFTWTRIEALGYKPMPRLGHSAMVTSDGQFMIIFAGYCSTTYVNDLYLFNLVTHEWVEVYPQGTAPNPRWAQTALLVDNAMWMFGGYNDWDKIKYKDELAELMLYH